MRMAAGWRWIVAACVVPAACALALAGEHYTEYEYDADGRVHQVRTAVDDAPPVVTSITPEVARRGPPTRITVQGSSLRAAQIDTDAAGIVVSAVTASATKITFDLTVADSVPLGPHTLGFTTALGHAEAQVTVRPRLPVLSMLPNPMALAPGSSVAVMPRFDSADVIDHNIAVTTANPAIAKVAPGSVTIPAGALVSLETLTVSAEALGNTVLRLDTDEVRDLAVPVFVTAPYQPPPGGAMFHSLLLGLHLGAPATPPMLIERGPFATRLGLVMPAPAAGGNGIVAPLAAPMLGLSLGSAVTALAPRTVVRGGGSTAVLAHGIGLDGVSQAAIVPSNGMSISVLSAGPTSVALDIAADADAATGLRTVRLLDAQNKTIPAVGLSDRILVADPLPQLDSVTPQLLVRGAGTQTVTVRGERLSGAYSVSALPPDGMLVGSEPVVSPDGRMLTVDIGVSADAPLGPRTLVVTTPAGSSDGTPASGNTLHVTAGIARTISPLAAARVGLLFDAGGGPSSPPGLLGAPVLGLNVGPAFTGMSPQTGAAGSDLVLQVFGHGLDAVTGVAISPDDGITLGNADPAADGTSLSVSMHIAADAARLPRRIVLTTPTGELVPTVPEAARFLVTDVAPELDAVTPLHVVAGAPTTVLTLHGRHFHGATAVSATPGDDIALGPPAPAPDGLSLTVTVSAAADAERTARVLTVSTPAGVSDAQASDANRLHVVSGIVDEIAPLAAARVGLQVGDGMDIAVDRLFAAPLLGVTLGELPSPPSPLRLLAGARMGVTVGPTVHAVTPRHLAIGSSVELQVSGVSLHAIDTVSVLPSTGIVVDGPLQIAADGQSLTVPITIDAAAPQMARRVVASAGGVAAPDSDAFATQVLVVGKQPLIDSIEPIQVVPGQAFVLKVRGINLHGTSAVTATPATGLAIGNNPQTNADGTEVAVAVTVSPSASALPRVIRLTSGGGTTSPEATPANTLHIVNDE